MINPEKLFGRLGNRLFQMAYIYAQMREGKIPDIYAQDYRLFEKYQDEIKKWFGDDIDTLPYVAIHIRRGDYVDNPFYVNLADDTNYYQESIKLFPKKEFLVFSDDINFSAEWMRKNIHSNFWFIDDSVDSIEALNRMASCQGIITANSSLSWWAAFLCPHKDKKIVAPSVKNWYTSGQELTKCPSDWVRI